MIVSAGKSLNTVTMPTSDRADRRADERHEVEQKMISTASADAYGTPRIVSTMNEVTPATVACASAPADVAGDRVARCARAPRAGLAAVGRCTSTQASTQRPPPPIMKAERMRIVTSGEQRVDDAEPDVASTPAASPILRRQLLGLLSSLPVRL